MQVISVTLKRVLLLAALFCSSASAAKEATQRTSDQAALSSQEQPLPETMDSSWQRVAPGVFERKLGGSVRRVHVGAAGLQADLQEAEEALAKAAQDNQAPSKALVHRVQLLRTILSGDVPAEFVPSCIHSSWYPTVRMVRNDSSCRVVADIGDIFGPPTAPDQCSSQVTLQTGGLSATRSNDVPRELCWSEVALPHGGQRCCMTGNAWLACRTAAGGWATDSISKADCL